MLERAVTWIIILIVIVFDPLAVIMLLASQMTFGWSKEQKADTPDPYLADVGEKPTLEEIKEDPLPAPPMDVGVTEVELLKDLEPLPPLFPDPKTVEEPSVPMTEESELEKWNRMIEEAEKEVLAQQSTVEERVAKGESYINNEGQEISAIDLPVDESKKKTYMIKDEQGQTQIVNKQ